MRILIVTPYLPHARVGHGGGTAVRQQVQALARRHEVHLLALRRPADPHPEDLDLADLASVATVAFRDRSARGAARLGLLADRARATVRAWRGGHPLYAAKYAQPDLLRRAVTLMRELQPDVVQVEYLQLAAVLQTLVRERPEGPPPRLVLSSHEYGALPRRRRAATAPAPRRALLRADAARWDRLARDAGRWADAVLCVTDQDRDLFRAAGTRAAVTVPLGIDTRSLRPVTCDPASRRLLFVGSFAHPPNREAAALLCDRIWPDLATHLPGWSLVLAGPGSRDFLATRAPAPPGLTAAGFVDDLDQLFARSRLFLAPLFSGGGIKIKILEAMARGLPLVTTPIGAEGIATRAQDLAGWAESSEEFVARTVEMAVDPDLAAARAARARRHVEQAFSWDAVVSRLEAVYRDESPSGG